MKNLMSEYPFTWKFRTELYARLLELENVSPNMYKLMLDKISYMLISKSLSDLDK